MKFDHSSHHHNHHHTISSLAGVNNAQHHHTTSTQFQPAQQQSQQQQTHQLDCPNNSNSNSLPQANVIISDPNCDVISTTSEMIAKKNINKSEKYRSDSIDKRKSQEDHDDAEFHK